MSAKALKDESSDLKKQIGCISGFFQLFDRHRFLTGQRFSSISQNKPTSGGSGNHIKELNGTMQKATASKLKVAREKQQFSTESSITSMSSSCSSSMSSLEFNRAVQIEPPSISQTKFPEIPSSGAAMMQLNTKTQQPLDFHDIVKDSMHREARGLSVKTVVKDEKKGHTLKYIDSPRPLQAHKSVNTAVMVANEPFHILAKSQKIPWDSPRLSYDGREIQDSFKYATRHKELPRLSLDSREASIRSFNEGTKSRNSTKGLQKGNGGSSTMLNQPQEPETSKRPSSVVAKLMGLETFPDWAQTGETPLGSFSCSTNKREPLARQSTSDEYKQQRSSGSPRTCKESTLHLSRQSDSTPNETPYSRFSLEPTPWRRPDASQGSESPASKGREYSPKASNPSLSVYGEIEKRVAELEFKKSGKDLRALKQILEAMQRYKDSLDITRDRASNSPSDSRCSVNESSTVRSPRIRQKDPISVTVERPNSPQGGKLPIVIMKPAKVTMKTYSSASTDTKIHGKSGLSKFQPGNPTNGRLINNQPGERTAPTTRNLKDAFSQPLHLSDKRNKMRTSKLMQSSKASQDINGGNTTSSGNITGTESPRLQQKKFGLERRSQPTSPSSDSNSNRRQQNRHSVELSSSSTTPRIKFSTLQEGNDGFSKASYHRRDSKHHTEAVSPDVDRKKGLTTHSDREVLHIDQSEKIKSTSFKLYDLNQNNAAKELTEERYKAETTVMVEQPSPVSVLDAAFYRDDLPSPVKKKSAISRDLDEVLNIDVDSEENSAFLSDLSNTTKVNFSSGIGDCDLSTRHLAQMLQQIDCTHEEINRPLSDSKDLDHQYISEILLASGLLSNTSASQTFHSPGHLINPKLFLALEQIKTNKRLNDFEDSAKKITKTNCPAQMQRKLIFDVVNDILVQKLVRENSSTQWFMANKLAGSKQRGHQLLDELCSEIDQLPRNNKITSLEGENEELTSFLWGDLYHPTIRTECCNEIPDIVLDIERLIFKDLITEVVRGEAANHLGSHCRQLLFSK